jgi:acetolactate synthase-1/2/3 large subunit
MLPADVSWEDGAEPAPAEPRARAEQAGESVSADAVAQAAKALRSGEHTVLLIGGDATREPGLSAAARIAEATGATLLCETFPARLERGAGRPVVGRLGYLAEMAAYQLGGAKHLVLAGAPSPVTFFAYPGQPSDLVPQGCQVHVLAGPGAAAAAALGRLAEELAPGTVAPTAPAARPELPTGPLTAESAAAVVGALLPEDAVVVDEANTSGLALNAATEGAPRHDWLTLTGGAIGYGLPAATGAAVAAPDRPVLCLESDGSAMYTISALWTQARENLDVTTVIYNNAAYAILRMELQRVGAQGAGADGGVGPRARSLLDLGEPTLDFVALATGMGVPARRAETAEEFADALRAALAEPGPHLIDAIVPPLL